MSSQIVATIILSFIIFSNVCISKSATVSNPLCEPGIVDDMPQHIRRVCMALENSNQLSSALSNYLKNEASALMYKPDDLIASNTGKRTDVDHVFLRFGRRR